MVKLSTKLQSRHWRGGEFLALLIMAILAFSTGAYAQQRSVSGKIIDQSGAPLIGATVIETGTTNGTTTDIDGRFTLPLKGAGQSVDVASLGYLSQTIALAGKTSLDVTLQEDAIGIEAVVAVGYGTVRQKDLTTAVSIVSTDDLDTRPIT